MADPASSNPNEALTGRVVEALREDPRINPSQVTPLAADGVVILTGQVDSIEDYNAAMEVVAHVPGVTNVVNEVRLLGRQPLHADDRHDVEKKAVGSPHGGPQ
jgi:osmotically-inducible protein OsmY